jgi:hypothetical protein
VGLGNGAVVERRAPFVRATATFVRTWCTFALTNGAVTEPRTTFVREMDALGPPRAQ